MEVGFGVRPAVPWQEAQDIDALRLTEPLRWVPPARMFPDVSTLVSWHRAQEVIPLAVRWLGVAGGAPWQTLQLVGPRRTSTAPLMWLAAATVLFVYPAWQLPQAVFWTCGTGGGAPWQLAQALKVPSTWVHTGAVPVPPATAAVPPWQ
jgi:hypothetical protein